MKIDWEQKSVFMELDEVASFMTEHIQDGWQLQSSAHVGDKVTGIKEGVNIILRKQHDTGK